MAVQIKVGLEMIDIPDLTLKIRKACLRKAVGITRKYARRAAPKRTGKLRRDMQYGVSRDGEKAWVNNTSHHAHLVRNRVEGHALTRKRRLMVFKSPNGDTIYRRSTGRNFHHPGSKGNDFLNAGLVSAKSEIMIGIGMIVDKERIMADMRKTTAKG